MIGEVRRATEYFPQIREVFFDDDTLTDARPWVEDIARGLGEVLVPKGMTWSTNAKVNVPYETLKVLKENGLRLFTVGFETGSQQILNNIKKGMKVEWAHEFAENCHKLGIKMHGTFIVGLPGETQETSRETIEFVKRINPHTIQVSLPAPLPGTFLYDQAKREGWLRDDSGELVAEQGFQVTSLEYPHLSHQEIFEMQERLYREFFFRPTKIAEIFWEMLKSPMVMRRRLREGVEFLQYLRARQNRPSSGIAPAARRSVWPSLRPPVTPQTASSASAAGSARGRRDSAPALPRDRARTAPASTRAGRTSPSGTRPGSGACGSRWRT